MPIGNGTGAVPRRLRMALQIGPSSPWLVDRSRRKRLTGSFDVGFEGRQACGPGSGDVAEAEPKTHGDRARWSRLPAVESAEEVVDAVDESSLQRPSSPTRDRRGYGYRPGWNPTQTHMQPAGSTDQLAALVAHCGSLTSDGACCAMVGDCAAAPFSNPSTSLAWRPAPRNPGPV